MIYLDHTATTKPYPEVIEAVRHSMETDFFNPASLYKAGTDLQRKMNRCFSVLADILGCSTQNLIQTSCATESTNMALKGLFFKYGKRLPTIIAMQSDHAATLECLKYLGNKGANVILLKPLKNGAIDEKELVCALDDKVLCVSLLYVNNESGHVLPIERYIHLIRQYAPQAYIHGDFVQAWGKLQFHLQKSDLDLVSLSAHKIHGPKGVGLLYIADNVHPDPLLHGGGQQAGLRSGTDNLALLEGMTVAAQIQEETFSARKKLVIERRKLIEQALPNLGAVQNFSESIEEILSISFPGLRGEIILHMLEENQIYLSTSSACHSSSHAVSHVLTACGIGKNQAQGTLRISIDAGNTTEEITTFCEVLKAKTDLLRSWI